jgi:hypothetical protein
MVILILSRIKMCPMEKSEIMNEIAKKSKEPVEKSEIDMEICIPTY